jgi:hypothetical protein
MTFRRFTTVREHVQRSVRVTLPNGELSQLIYTKKVAESFGVLIDRIRDFEEDGLLKPLSKSVLNYAKMLLPDDPVRLIALRIHAEFRRLWGEYHGMCQQMILVGHGFETDFVFGDEEVSAQLVRGMIEEPLPSPNEIISMLVKQDIPRLARKYLDPK